MNTQPKVSVVIIFLNEKRFLSEAVESVLSQTFQDWELFLVDDGSTDGSTEIAKSYAALQTHRVAYLDHPGHANRGMSASRNLGFAHARGQLVALLDADDVWLPAKLHEQVELLDATPEAEMVYGQTRYWFSWTTDPANELRDFAPRLGVRSHTVVYPPALLPKILSGQAAVPCPSSIMMRRGPLMRVGGFEERFVGIYGVYEDQAFYSKFFLIASALVVEKTWDLYRQHPAAITARVREAGQQIATRRFFLKWLQGYLLEMAITDDTVWRAVEEQLWLLRFPRWLPSSTWKYWRWAKKWILRSGAARRPMRSRAQQRRLRLLAAKNSEVDLTSPWRRVNSDTGGKNVATKKK
jgi:glycosyltransferase involved in cell wall biosynthesis